ncbi:DUF6602 domain-containing protein [Rhodococcus sp. PSBB049]|uniref:DUF6602 domain-containing protein n=1 Tax=Rhodococcus sp. PSBB049 TaxID=2812863 RepID=UPI001981D3D1|nr:DUF6602 domain-containing protein [Rhodococcus sp. PSBB049]QSE72488.1 hypothetical protein JYA91_29685 [Rhodococcus sp. PSBB049]
MVAHRYHKWLNEISQQMQSGFEDAHAEAAKSSGAQKAGHHGEEIWGRFLQEWLPPQYEIGYRKYIILENEADDGSDVSGETDIVVFHPSYPSALRKRHEILLSGVAAAFSSKLTLNKAGIEEAVQEAARLRRAAKLRSHDIHGKILTPFVYGILAHTHSWKSPTSKPVEAITSALMGLDAKFSAEPREALDLLCVADLNCWSKHIMIVTPQQAAILPASVAAASGHIQYTFLNIGNDSSAKDASALDQPPVAFLIGLLYQKLSYYDGSLSALADGFRVTGTGFYSLSQAGNAGNRIFPPASILGPSNLGAFGQGLLLRTMYW